MYRRQQYTRVVLHNIRIMPAAAVNKRGSGAFRPLGALDVISLKASPRNSNTENRKQPYSPQYSCVSGDDGGGPLRSSREKGIFIAPCFCIDYTHTWLSGSKPPHVSSLYPSQTNRLHRAIRRYMPTPNEHNVKVSSNPTTTSLKPDCSSVYTRMYCEPEQASTDAKDARLRTQPPGADFLISTTYLDYVFSP